MNALPAILRAVCVGPVHADSIEAGLDALAQRLDTPLSRSALADAVREGVRSGLLHDPVRLPPGALQCHWHLEPTGQGRRATIL